MKPHPSSLRWPLPAGLAAALVLACGSTSPPTPGATAEPGASAPTAPNPPTPTPAPVDLTTVFPEIAGFTHPELPDAYSPATLYDYIDGAAELFLHYGFVELASLEYRRGSGATEQAITADVYRHSSDNNGYGIYSRDHVRTSERSGIGAAAAYGPGALHFYQGRYYVKLTGFQLGDDDEERLRETAIAIAARLDGPDTLPPAVACFPTDPLSPVEYHATGYLGHGFLEAVFAADYRAGDTTTKLLLIEAADPAAAAATLASYRALAEKKAIAVTTDRAGTLRLGDPYHRELGPLHARQLDRYALLVFAAEDGRATSVLDQVAACLARVQLIPRSD